ncbi:MAG: PotD/PotF family extracellular solute-binding protein [Burkholderiales bacterium]
MAEQNTDSSAVEGVTRRQFVAGAAGIAATGAIAGFPAIVQAQANNPIRTIGLGVSIINELQGRASKDLKFPVRGQALSYTQLFSKTLNQNDQYEVSECYFDMFDVMIPAGVFQPIDTKRIKDWGKVSNLTKTGKLTEGSSVGDGDAPYLKLWVDQNGKPTKGPSQYISAMPTWHNADSLGYTPKNTKRDINSWAELFSPDFKGRVALINVPQIGAMDAAMGVEALGLIKFKDKGNMTKQEIDFLVDFLIKKKKEGHFRAFWESFGQSVNLMTSGEVVLQSMWSPAVTAVNAEGVKCIYAAPKEGMRGWHGAIAISAKLKGRQLDQAYEYINWWLTGWPGAFVARQGYYMSAPQNVKAGLSPGEWEFWYEGKPAASNLNDPFGNKLIEKGAVRDGGSYEQRFKSIAVWNSLMDENDYLVKRWTEFLNA